MIHPYGTERYAKSLPHVGEPFAVPEWETHVLIRPAQGGAYDAVGTYPLAVIAAGADLEAGLSRLKAAGLVSVVFVLDDILRPPLGTLQSAFDVVRPFKTHYLHDRTLAGVVYGKHHRYEIKRALGRVSVLEISLADHLESWRSFYEELTARHQMSGVHAFPAAHHEALASLAGVRTFGAFADGELVSAHVFVAHDGYAFSHLAASTGRGYEIGAAYAVNAAALTNLNDCRLINFGGGPGTVEDPANGLVRFKKGFSNRAAPSFLCGKVLDPAVYEALSSKVGETEFFPAYRHAAAQERIDAD